jgi:hypothetical protein
MPHLSDFLFDYTGPVEFIFHTPIEASIERLEGAIHEPTARTLLMGSRDDLLIGQASRDYVRLSRLKTSLKGNVFRPYFYGNFADRDGSTVLSGKFTMKPVWKVLLGLPVLIFTVVGVLLTVVGLGALNGSTQGAYAIGGPVLIGVAFGFVFFVKWLFRADVQWLSKRIEDASR